jgi:Retrotransposon gag protein
MQFYEDASEWYDDYLIDHNTPDWDELVRLVHVRFKKVNTKSTLDKLQGLNQHGTVEEYWYQFES